MESLISSEFIHNQEIVSPKWLTQVFELLGFLVGGFVAGMLGMHRYNRNMERKKSKNFLDIPESYHRIQEALMYLRIKTNASRVRLCEFHNGGKFLSGEPMKKFSATKENVKSGVSSESFKIKDFLTTNFSEKMDMIRENNPKIYSVSDLPNCDTKYFARSMNVKKLAILPIFKERETIIGFIEVEWNTDEINTQEQEFSSLFFNIRSQVEFLKSRKEVSQQ